MKDFFPVMMKSPLFSGIAQEDLGAMLACLGACARRFSKGEVILAEGEPAARLGMVLSGSVQVSRTDLSGNRSLLAILGPAQMFAEAFACAGVEVMPVSVSALEETQVLLVDASRITHGCAAACGFHQRMIDNLMRILALKNLAANQKIEVISRRTTREKLMTYLMLCAAEAGSSRFTIPFDRQALADYLEVDRSGLSAEIGKLRREGVLECTRSSFSLLRM